MRRRLRWILLLLGLVAAPLYVYVYVRSHPLVFMKAHAHCIKWAGLELLNYAEAHEGRFPYHPKGYGNALLLMDEDCYQALTGPGYDAAPFWEAKRTGKELSEEDCGRVYIQGLTLKSNHEIAFLFDKLSTPGGDHRHLPARVWAPLTREVLLVGGIHINVRESEWPEFTEKQIELLVQEGFPREEAERLFASKPK